MTAAKNELVRAYQPYVKSPGSYPGYEEMWVTFWNTRYQKLRDGTYLNFRLTKC